MKKMIGLFLIVFGFKGYALDSNSLSTFEHLYQTKIFDLTRNNGKQRDFDFPFYGRDIGLTGRHGAQFILSLDTQIVNVTYTGTPEITHTIESCTPHIDPNFHSCIVRFLFTPVSVGLKSGTAVVTFQDQNGAYATSIFITAHGLRRPADRTVCESGSIVNVGEQTLSEAIPIVGTPWALVYNSSISQSMTSEVNYFIPKPFYGEDGWTFSPQAHFDARQSRFFDGYGNVRHQGVPSLGPTYNVFSLDGSEYYIFDIQGKHLETRTGITNGLKHSFGYDIANRLISISDAFGNSTTIQRDTNGKITSITGPYGDVTNVALNAEGQIQSVVSPNSETYLMTYKPGTDLLETFTKPGGQVSTFLYDNNGKLTKDSSIAGNFWEIIRTSATSLEKKSALNRISSYSISRDVNGLFQSTETEPSGLSTAHQETLARDSITESVRGRFTTKWVNDERVPALGRMSERRSRLGTIEKTTTFSQILVYPAGVTPGLFNLTALERNESVNGRLYRSRYQNESTGHYWYDFLPSGVLTYRKMDEFERPIRIRHGNFLPVNISYDSRGRLREIVQNEQMLERYSYDSQGNVESVTNGRNEVTAYQYDLSHRVTKIIFPDLSFVNKTYDANGNLTGITPPSKPIHEIRYNAFDLINQYLPPAVSGVSNKDTTFAYNLDKQLTKSERPDGQSLILAYDNATGLLTSKDNSFSMSTLTYQSASDLIQKIDVTNSIEGTSTEFTYFGDRLKSQELKRLGDNFSYGKIDRTFNSFHLISSRILQGHLPSSTSTVTYQYNVDSKPSLVGSMSLTYYNDSGSLRATTLARISDLRTYDDFGRLKTYEVKHNPIGNPSKIIYAYTLTRDVLGRIEARTEQVWDEVVTYSYEYDVLGRLKKVYRNGSLNTDLNYDLNGNRINGTVDGQSFIANYDGQDRLMSYGSRAYSYNANGDTATVTAPLGAAHYNYNAESFLTSATTINGKAKTYNYDGLNNLIQIRENGVLKKNFMYESENRIAAELSPVGDVLKEYIHVTNVTTPDIVRANGNVYRVITDHLGSVRLVVNVADGKAIQRIDYNVFGKVTRDTNSCWQPYGFAGGIYDPDTHLVKFGARQYDAEVGRWTSKDPILFDGGDTNLYGYVTNDPINFIDPKGTFTEEAVARRTTPNQQMAIGTGAAAAGAACIKTGYSTLNPYLIGAGIVIGYEGAQNMLKAKSRGAPNIEELLNLNGSQVP